MKYTFKLKEPNSEKETLILFSSYFKNENRKFIFSTGENIHPKNWDKINKFPYTNGSIHQDKTGQYKLNKSKLLYQGTAQI